MIKYNSQKQLTLKGFETPFEMNLDPTNRWVLYAHKMPWDDLVSIYCRKMSSKQGAGAKNPRMMIGALFIKHVMKLSDVETIEMIRENVYMQYFLGLSGYTSSRIFDPSLFVYIRKRLGISEFNEFTSILEECEERKRKSVSKTVTGKNAAAKSEDKDGGNNGSPAMTNGKSKQKRQKSPNVHQTKKTAPADQRTDCVKLDEEGRKHKGDMLLDATACVADIKYPTDLDLLNDCREKSEHLIDAICERTGQKKPRTYRQNGRKAYLESIKRRNIGKKKRKAAIKQQIQFVRRDIKLINDLLDNCPQDVKIFDRSERKYFYVIQTVLWQQEQMYKTDTHTIEDRIVSIHQPHVRAIPRGKARNKIEFGSKIDLSMHDGYGYIERFNWGAFNEGEDLQTGVYNYYMRYGYYPARIFIDKIYATKENIKWLKYMNIQFVGLPLGKAAKEYLEAQKKLLKGLGLRNGVEGRFGLIKRTYDMDLVKAKTALTAESWIGACNFVSNFMNFIAGVLFVLLQKMARYCYFKLWWMLHHLLLDVTYTNNLKILQKYEFLSA